MKDIIIRTVACLASLVGTASAQQAGELLWAVRIGGGEHEFAYDVDAFDDGRVVVVGEHWGPIVFEEGGTSHVPTGECDGFVACYDGAGALLWARTMGGPYSDRAVRVSVLAGNQVAVEGWGFGTLDFDGISFLASVETPFVAIYDEHGVIQSAQADPAYSQTAPSARIELSPGGGALEAGAFEYARPIPGATALHGSRENGFLVETDSSGLALWAVSLGGAGSDRATAVTLVPRQATCAVTGVYRDDAVLGSTSGPGTPLDKFTPAAGRDPQHSDVFLAVYRVSDGDSDGLSDIEETAQGTNPSLRDSDGDGVWDPHELLAGTNPNDPGSAPASLDWAWNRLGLPTSTEADGTMSYSVPEGHDGALLSVFLKSGSAPPQTQTGLRAAWDQNLLSIRAQTDGSGIHLTSPHAWQTLLAAYATISGGDVNVAPIIGFIVNNLAAPGAGFALDTSGMDLRYSALLSAVGDADCDGFVNAEEYTGGSYASYVANAGLASLIPSGLGVAHLCDNAEPDYSSTPWTTTWTTTTAQSRSAQHAWAATSSSGNHESPFFDLTGAAKLTISVRRRHDGWANPTNARLELWDGTQWNPVLDLGQNAADAWHWNIVSETSSAYFNSTFRFRIANALAGGENLWIDDVVLRHE